MKLSAKFFGPYQIIARIGKVAYKLALPPTSNIHPVFHISQLRKAHLTRTTADQTVLIPAEPEGHIEPEAVLDKRMQTRQGKEEVLIRWKGLPSYEATWEEKERIQVQFPEFHLEDKVRVMEGGIDKDAFALNHEGQTNRRVRTRSEVKRSNQTLTKALEGMQVETATHGKAYAQHDIGRVESCAHVGIQLGLAGTQNLVAVLTHEGHLETSCEQRKAVPSTHSAEQEQPAMAHPTSNPKAAGHGLPAMAHPTSIPTAAIPNSQPTRISSSAAKATSAAACAATK